MAKSTLAKYWMRCLNCTDRVEPGDPIGNHAGKWYCLACAEYLDNKQAIKAGPHA